MSGITIDGIDYDVIITSNIERAFELKQGGIQGTSQNGREIPDILGTNYTFTMSVEPHKDNFVAYDAFYQKITEPVDYHTVSVPYGQTFMTFQAMILSGTDKLRRKVGSSRRWGALKIQMKPIEPQRTDATSPENAFMLRHMGNGGIYTIAGSPSSTLDVPYSSTAPSITVNIENTTLPVRSGYVLIGWASTEARANNGNVDYPRGGSITLQANTTTFVYAVWQAANHFVLRHNGNGGTYGSDSYWDDEYDDVRSSLTVEINNTMLPVRTGYALIGWASTQARANNGIVDYSRGDSITLQANVTTNIYAVWQEQSADTAYLIDELGNAITFGGDRILV